MAKYTKPDPSKIDIKLLWQKTVLDQVQRVMEALSEDPKYRFEKFYMAVMGLDSIMKHYQDPGFANSTREIEEGIKYMLNDLNKFQKGNLDENVLKNIDFIRSKFKLDQLMLLMGRAGLYPDMEAGASEEGGVYENNKDKTENDDKT